MHDIQAIRKTPQDFDAGLKRRGIAPHADTILKLDKSHRDQLTQLQTLQSERNTIAKQFGQLKRNGEDTSALSERMETIKSEMKDLEESTKISDTALKTILSELPNIPDADTPDGLTEDENVLTRSFGTPKTFDFTPKHHFELGEQLGMMDFETAANMSGSRFVVLKGPLARLERALGQFMLDIHTEDFGYTEINPPLMVHDGAMFGVGQLPKFKEDMFQTNSGHWLISTAEVVLTNLVANQVTPVTDLPLRFTAQTPCFRAEAGSAGRDTRGMIRQHQFSKVELVSITTPEQAKSEHERMTEAAETILQKLDLPYQLMTLCCGDMGFSAVKTYDMNVWLPGQNMYREISSCSHCGDFQGRRMHARFKPTDKDKPKPLHTLNGSGLALGRTLVAVMENYQNADGSITIPDVLVPYMRGLTKITVD